MSVTAQGLYLTHPDRRPKNQAGPRTQQWSASVEKQTEGAEREVGRKAKWTVRHQVTVYIPPRRHVAQTEQPRPLSLANPTDKNRSIILLACPITLYSRTVCVLRNIFTALMHIPVLSYFALSSFWSAIVTCFSFFELRKTLKWSLFYLYYVTLSYKKMTNKFSTKTICISKTLWRLFKAVSELKIRLQSCFQWRSMGVCQKQEGGRYCSRQRHKSGGRLNTSNQTVNCTKGVCSSTHVARGCKAGLVCTWHVTGASIVFLLVSVF